MANRGHLAILKKGTDAWNAWRRVHAATTPDLTNAQLLDLDCDRADLSRADLRGAFFDGVSCRMADLTNAKLDGAYLIQVSEFDQTRFDNANLTRAEIHFSDFEGASFQNADFTNAKLDGFFSNAKFRGARFWGTTFTNGANLREADFCEARMKGAVFADVDLSRVRGLRDVIHEAPSTIGIDTLYRSQGKLPDLFLRGAGVPDTLMSFAKKLVVTPLDYYSCFLSHSTKDYEFAARLYADLQGEGVRCWFAPHDMESGKKVYEQIERAIQLNDRLLLVLSDHSMNSEWVKTEIAHARDREIKEHRKVLFPIGLVPFARIRDWKCFDADTGKDSAREVREYFIPDFSEWKEAHSYQKGFQGLLTGLRTEGDTLK